MKVLVVVGLFIVAIVALFVISTPLVNQLSLCISEANNNSESNINLAKVEKWSREKVCLNGQNVISNLQLCYKSAEKQTFIPIFLIEGLAKIIKPNVLTLSKTIDVHNDACTSLPQYQLK